jgi:hypothetical protein
VVQVEYQGACDRLYLPAKLSRQMAKLASVVGSTDFAPPKQAYEVFDHLANGIDWQLQRLQVVLDQHVTRFASLVQKLQVPTIVPRSADEPD